MTKRIVFIGAAGCGKSTLSTEVFLALKKKHLNAELVTEWIRNDINRNGPMCDIFEQYRTRQHQKELEDAIPTEVEYLAVDSGTLTPYFYSCLYADHKDARQRLVLQDMYRYLLDDLYLRRYDYIFYLPVKQTYSANKKILSDGTRFQTMEEIDTLDDHMRLIFTKLHKLDNIFTADWALAERPQFVLDIIAPDLDKKRK
jgi:GTPase SAR1 family protein